MLRFGCTSFLEPVADAIDEVAFVVVLHALGPPAALLTPLQGPGTQTRKVGGGFVFHSIHSFTGPIGAVSKRRGQVSGRASPVANGRKVGPWRIRKRRGGTIPRPIHTAQRRIYV